MDSIKSISEEHGISHLTSSDKEIYSVGISTAGVAEAKMATGGKKRHIVATTLDKEGALFVKEYVKTLGLSDQVNVKIEDVTKDLPYPDEHFDYIYARLVLHYLPKQELEKALKNLYRVLKAKKKLFIVVRSNKCSEAQDENSTYDPDTGLTTYHLDGSYRSRYFHTEQSIKEHLTQAGFIIQHTDTYQELHCKDFKRKLPSKEVTILIEALATKP